jgi:hypothetical protein
MGERASGCSNRCCECCDDILTKELTWREDVRLDGRGEIRQRRVIVTRLEPVKEVIRLIGEKRHPPGRDVEEVIRLARPEREARSDAGRGLDHGDVKRLCGPQKVERHGGSTKPSSDDNDTWWAFHPSRQSISVSPWLERYEFALEK